VIASRRRVKIDRRRARTLLLLASLLTLCCGESETPPLVPVVPAPPAPVQPPQVAPSASSSGSAAPSSSASPLADSAAGTLLRVADLLARPPPPGTYLVEASVIASGTHCPPCPPRVMCSPCPPTLWYLADTNDPGAARVRLDDQPPSLTSGARYRLRVEALPSPVKGVVRLAAVLARVARAPGGGATSDACDDCLSHRVEWGQTGGLAPTTLFAAEPCRGFARRTLGSAQRGVCTAHLACSPGLAGKLETFLAYSDVKAALARAPVVFGRDVRASDGTLLRIAVDGKELFFGPACDGAASCETSSGGVAQLASELSRAHVVTDDDACGAP
jgi:hypothetical protein